MSEETPKEKDDAPDQNEEVSQSIEDLFSETQSDGVEEERPNDEKPEEADSIEEGEEGIPDGAEGGTDQEEVAPHQHDAGSEQYEEDGPRESQGDRTTETDAIEDITADDNDQFDGGDSVTPENDSGKDGRDEDVDQRHERADRGAVGAGVKLSDVGDRTDPPQKFDGRSGGLNDRFSTGIHELDELLSGGIPPGRILCLVAPPDTQSELLVKHLTAQHNSLYLSTFRPKWEVEEEVTDFVQKHIGLDVEERRVRIEELTRDSRLDSARNQVEGLEGRTMVVIDSANELEMQQKEQYMYFLDDVKRTLWETGSVGLFYCIKEEQTSDCRAITLRRADMIWRLKKVINPDSVHHQIVVSKFRGGRALDEPLTMYLTDEVRVDAGPFSS